MAAQPWFFTLGETRESLSQALLSHSGTSGNSGKFAINDTWNEGLLVVHGFFCWYLVIQSDLFGMVSSRDPFKGLSDLQLGDEKVTLNHLVCVFFAC